MEREAKRHTSSLGPTVISTATLAEVASWFPGLSVHEMRRRMRANIEIDGVPAFWEDQLFSEHGDLVSFRVGDVHFFGDKPCQRCIVPTRDSYLERVYKIILKQLSNDDCGLIGVTSDAS